MSVVTAVKRFNPNYCLTLNLSFIWQRRRVRVVDLIARLRQQTEVSFIKPSAGVKRCCLLCGWCNPCHLFVSLPGSVDITRVARPFDCYSAESFPFDDPLTDGYWCLVPSGSPLFRPTLRFSALVVSALPFVPLSSPLMISSLSDVPLKSRCSENREAKCAAKGINLRMTKDTKERKTRKRPFQVFISTNPLLSLQKGHKLLHYSS